VGNESREEFEEIPWSHLIPDTTPGGNRTVVVAGGVLLALLIGVVGARMLSGGPQTVLEPVLAATSVATDPETVDSSVAAPAMTTTTNVLYAEADLMAAIVPSAEPSLSATYFATRFVRDFFTVDGDAAARSRIARLFVDGEGLPLPHDRGNPTTYVEWVEVTRSTTTQDGLDVVVAFQMLEQSADPGEDFVRSEVLEATVSLVATADGYSVASLPRVALAAVQRSQAVWSGNATAPQWAIDEGMRDVGVFAADATVIAAEPLSNGDWRLVLLASRPSGVAWPIQVVVTAVP
jgi:hypothetical protein